MRELFENFELNKEPKWPTLLRLTGGSVLLHLGLLWLVVYVPAVRDALNIAALIANTRFVDKAYSRTQITDEVTLVDVANQKFHYPEGYFALENQLAGEQLVAGASGSDPFAPKIISRAESQKDLAPEASPSPSPAASPSTSPSATASPSTVAEASASASPGDKDQKLTPEEAQKKLEQTAAENNLELPEEGELNKQVLKDFAKYANDLKEQGKLDLDKPFEVVIEAELDETGKLINPRFTKKAGDPNLVDVFARMVAALNDSGYLIYLKPISKDNPNTTVKFTFKQGETEVLASVESEASSTASARVLAKALNAALVFGASSRAGKDEAVLMKNTNVTPDGKKVLLTFSMPRQTVVDMIKKQLEPGI
jgi:hypothetical protein